MVQTFEPKRFRVELMSTLSYYYTATVYLVDFCCSLSLSLLSLVCSFGLILVHSQPVISPSVRRKSASIVTQFVMA